MSPSSALSSTPASPTARAACRPPHGFDATRPDTIGRLPGALRDTALDAFAHATAMGYLWIAPTLAVGTLLALFLKSARKTGKTTDTSEPVTAQDAVPAA